MIQELALVLDGRDRVILASTPSARVLFRVPLAPPDGFRNDHSAGLMASGEGRVCPAFGMIWNALIEGLPIRPRGQLGVERETDRTTGSHGCVSLSARQAGSGAANENDPGLRQRKAARKLDWGTTDAD
ncbi:hypothetical protein BRAS3843_1060033 [Bradyrhizobium sp. STM 3843]|nr:hypothetical protein BRAS3843_1060033 [Bradyrhizobium sp. STM 3843]